MIEYFLDTSFLIPFFGMSINIKNIEKDFENILNRNEPIFGYSDISLVEIRFLIENKIRKGSPVELRDEYAVGLDILEYSDQFQNVGISDVDVSNLEIKFLTKYNYKDYFDCLIMASSYFTSKYLVTMDGSIKSTMKEFIRDTRTKVGSQFIKVISWNEMVKIVDEEV